MSKANEKVDGLAAERLEHLTTTTLSTRSEANPPPSAMNRSHRASGVGSPDVSIFERARSLESDARPTPQQDSGHDSPEGQPIDEQAAELEGVEALPEAGAVVDPFEESGDSNEGVELSSPSSGPMSSVHADKIFELTVVQQPEIGAEAGLGKITLGRLPIVPAPVVRLHVRNQDGEEIDSSADLPFLICSCALRQEDGASAVEIAQPQMSQPSGTGSALADSSSSGSDEVLEEFSALIGGLVRDPRAVNTLEGLPASFFVFEDMSVRTRGRYTLEFRLGEAQRPKGPKLASVLSEPFDVVTWEAYPGRPAKDTLTPLSRHLYAQGVPMYIPPLVMSPPGSHEPLLPSQNPFPPGVIPQELAERLRHQAEQQGAQEHD